MDISHKKLQANRRNASRSTGPRTKAGKKRSRWNAFKHGLTAKKTLLAKGESRTEYRKLHRGLRRDLKPKGTLLKIIVQQLAACQVQLQRVGYIERNAFQAAADKARTKFIEAQIGKATDGGLDDEMKHAIIKALEGGGKVEIKDATYEKALAKAKKKAKRRDWLRLPKAKTLELLARYQTSCDKRVDRLLERYMKFQRLRRKMSAGQ